MFALAPLNRPRANFLQHSKSTIAVAFALMLIICATLHAQTPVAHLSGVQRSFPNPATYPYGLAVGKSGNIFVADNDYDTANEVFFINGVYRGTISLGTFQQPWGIAADADDNVYIVENSASDVVKETQTVTPYGNYYTASVLPTSGLNNPRGIAVDSANNVYISDGDRIVRLTPQGNTYVQSTVPTSKSYPLGIAVDFAGAIYFTDPANRLVRKETPSGNTYTESTVADNLPPQPVGVAVDGQGNVYILCITLGGSDTYNLLKETPTAGGYTQSVVHLSPYQNPYGIAADASGNLFIDSPGTGGLTKLSPAPADFGMVNAGSPGASFTIIFTFDSGATLATPQLLTQGAPAFDFTDAGTGSCTYHGNGDVFNAGDSCSIDLNFRPLFPGSRKGAANLLDTAGNLIGTAYLSGTGLGPQPVFPPGKQAALATGLGDPQGVAVDSAGNVFVADNQGGVVYKESRSVGRNLRTIVAGGLNHPTGVAIDGAGNLFVATAAGLYQENLLSGSYTQKPLITSLINLTGVAVDGDGNLYITSPTSGNIHKETLASDGTYVQSAVGFGITHPGGLSVDGNGTIFVTAPLQGTVYKETLQTSGSYQQTTVASDLAGPQNVVVDGGGDLYITGSLSGDVYQETPDGNGHYVQSIAFGGLTQPWGIGLDSRGNLYFSLRAPIGQLQIVDTADTPILNFAKTPVGSTSQDSPQLVTLANIGNTSLSIPVLSLSANPSITSGFTLSTSTTCPVQGMSSSEGSVAATSSCGYEINYRPVVAGAIRGAMVITDAIATQRVELRQGITSDATRVSLRILPNQIKKGLKVTLTATVTDTSVPFTLPTGGSVTFTDTLSGRAVVLNGGAPVPLNGGEAAVQIVPSAGVHTITAHYGGVDASFAASTGEGTLDVYSK